MMDNYDQGRINSNRLEQLDDVHHIKLQERNEFFRSVEEFTVNKQNFNFGANILNTKTMSNSSSSMASTTNNSCGEDVVKTNNEIIKQFSLPPAAEINLQATANADTPVSVTAVDSLNTAVNQEQLVCNNFSKYCEDNENSQQSQNCANFHNSSKENDDDDEDNPADDTDDSTSDSDFSDLSGLSDMSGRDWKPINQRPFNWVQKQIHSGANPREIFSKFLPSAAQRISPELTDMTLWRILASVLSEPPRRKKLSYVNTFEDVIDLLHKSKNIIVLTGAGVSVSCGIPDFRSSDGIYSRLAKDFPDLPGPQAMFDINYFSRDPRPFYKFAREIYPGQFKPSPCHRFIKMLEQKQKLLRNYTQNIDTLEQVAGIKNVIECHGSFSTASCTKCKYKCDANSIRADIFAQRIPVCPICQPNVEQSLDASESVSEDGLRQLVENGIMKPDIVFFGEGLPDEFHTVMASDKDKCDLLIVMGSSLKVRPVALIPSSIPNQVPQILINREQLHHLEFDVELLGDGDVIINQICHRLGEEWKDICFNPEVLKESKDLIPLEYDIDGEDTAKEVSTDIDALSTKSNQSSEICLQSAIPASTTPYCYSGFETSSICSKKDVEFLSPDDLEEPMGSTSLGGPCDYRHLSIDSSKDSGILTDSSNSAPSFSNYPDAADINRSHNMSASAIEAIPMQPAVNQLSNTKTADNNCSEAEKQSIRRQMKHQSAAERLYKGTYYAHDNNTSYVFPGAQVSWRSDSEEDEENLEEYEDNPCNDDETNQAPLSPLMTPSVENEMVQAIASNNSTVAQHPSSPSINFTNAVPQNSCLSQHKADAQLFPEETQKRRHANDVPEEKLCNSTSKSFATEAKCSANDASFTSCPPIKRSRNTSDHTNPANSSIEPL